MVVDLNNLPNTVGELQEVIQKIHTEFAKSLEKEKSLNDNLLLEKEDYKKKYEDIRRLMFARKSESLKLSDEGQGRLFNEAEQVAPEAGKTSVVKSHRRKKKQPKERKATIPEGLPEKEFRHDIPEDQKACPCCEDPMQNIGEDTARELHVIPEKLIVHKHVYPKYACSECKDDSTVVSAGRNRLLPGSIVGSGLLSYIIQRKYQFGLPLYRINSMFKTIGVDISRQNMSNWIISAAEKLKPLYKTLKEELKKGSCLYIDETTLQVLKEPGRPNTTKSYMWHMRASLDKNPVCYFEYTEGRSTKFLDDWLRDYEGTILTDGWKSYDTLAASASLDHAGCWAHARRYFFKTSKEDPLNKDVVHVLKLIQKLFRLEKAYDKFNKPNDLRLKNRRRFSAPVINQIDLFISEIESKYPPKSRMGESIKYTKNQWIKLILFLEKPEVKIHNNDVENGIRPFVIGRKNWLFSGCPAGARASSLFYSLIETAKANGLNPYDYLTYLFEKFPLTYKESGVEKLSDLLPQNVTAADLSDFFAEYG
ncbi:MAG: IS66 family transposase [Leptospirales bacterium]